MKQITLSLGMIMVFLMNVYSQSGDSTITIQKDRYFQSGQAKTLREVNKILVINPASAPEMKKYSTITIAGSVLVGMGVGVGLGGLLVYLENGNKSSPLYHRTAAYLPISLVGFSVLIVGGIVKIGANRHFTNAIKLYNSKYGSTGFNSVQLDLMASDNGLGVRVTF